jgi:hypothetical protein
VTRDTSQEPRHCSYCGSAETHLAHEQGLFEWLLSRRERARLLRCHDCGGRFAAVELPRDQALLWQPGRFVFRVAGLALGFIGVCAVVWLMLNQAEQPEERRRRFVPPRSDRPRQASPAAAPRDPDLRPSLPPQSPPS